MNYQLICQFCSKTKSKLAVTPEQREIFNTAQKISPNSFAAFSNQKTADLKDVSKILKRIISGILGKDVVGEKSLSLRERGDETLQLVN
jgi:hypothetical protein